MVERNQAKPKLRKSYWFYHLAKALVLFYVRLFYGLKTIGHENVPREGGVLVASNHFSSLDPPVIGLAFPRVMSFMAKKELFEQPLLGFLIGHLQAFPVDRSGNASSAVKESIRRLRAGAALLIFAQGTRNAGEVKALDGAAFIAQRAAVPILPTAIWRQGRRFYVHFGKPIRAEGSSREETSKLTEKVMSEVNVLLPLEYRAKPIAES